MELTFGDVHVFTVSIDSNTIVAAKTRKGYKTTWLCQCQLVYLTKSIVIYNYFQMLIKIPKYICAVLPYAKLTISCCTPSVIARQQATCAVKLKLHLVNLLAIYYTNNKFC